MSDATLARLIRPTTLW